MIPKDSDPTKTEGKVETDGNNSHHNIADPIDFRIDGIADINGERNLDSTFLKELITIQISSPVKTL